MGSESAALLLHQNWATDYIWFLTLCLPLSITYATLRYNLLDIGAIMRRSLTYGLLSAPGVGGLSRRGVGCQQRAGRSAHGALARLSVLFALAVLFVMNPLRQRLQGLLDRSLFRSRYDFRQTIEALSRDLSALLDLDEIANRLVRTVSQALDVSRVALFLHDDADSDTLRAYAVAGDDVEHLSHAHPRRDDPIVALVPSGRRASRATIWRPIPPWRSASPTPAPPLTTLA